MKSTTAIYKNWYTQYTETQKVRTPHVKHKNIQHPKVSNRNSGIMYQIMYKYMDTVPVMEKDSTNEINITAETLNNF